MIIIKYILGFFALILLMIANLFGELFQPITYIDETYYITAYPDFPEEMQLYVQGCGEKETSHTCDSGVAITSGKAIAYSKDNKFIHILSVPQDEGPGRKLHEYTHIYHVVPLENPEEKYVDENVIGPLTRPDYNIFLVKNNLEKIKFKTIKGMGGYLINEITVEAKNN